VSRSKRLWPSGELDTQRVLTHATYAIENLPLGLCKIIPRTSAADSVNKNLQTPIYITFCKLVQNGFDPSGSLVCCSSGSSIVLQYRAEACLV
jgi:hypothetical protein